MKRRAIDSMLTGLAKRGPEERDARLEELLRYRGIETGVVVVGARDEKGGCGKGEGQGRRGSGMEKGGGREGNGVCDAV